MAGIRGTAPFSPEPTKRPAWHRVAEVCAAVCCEVFRGSVDCGASRQEGV